MTAAEASQRFDAAYDLAPITWRVEHDNDVFFHSDNKFTSGLSVQRHTNIARDWADLDMPAWAKFGRRLPGLGAAGLYRRMGFAVGQNIQTPSDLEATELIVDDVPYAGSLGAQLNWTAFDDDTFRGYGLIVGVVGPSSGAENVQKFIHELSGAKEPRGWEHQLPNEFAFNFNGMFKEKLARVGNPRRWSADLSIDGDFGLGTALIFAEAGVELRVGFNIPRGFTFLPDPIGRSLAYDAALIGQGAEQLSFYLSAVSRAVYMPHFIFLDGSRFRETHSVEKVDSLRQNIVGVHFSGRKWGLHFSFWNGSDIVDTAGGRDPDNDFGTVAVEWRF